MKKPSQSTKVHSYGAPRVFVWVFYTLLVAWTVVCVFLLGTKTIKVGWPLGQLLMIAFVLAYTWYFSLGIAYEIKLEDCGDIHLISFRREITINAKEIPLVEGPRFAILPYSFIRFRLEREKAYLFCRVTDVKLQQILEELTKANRDMKLKGLLY